VGLQSPKQGSTARLLIHLNALFRFPFSVSICEAARSTTPGSGQAAAQIVAVGGARRIIEEYASDLREIIKKLRRKLN
jgi:hypothetical protein